MTILAARPLVGKTTIMVQVADRVAEHLQTERGKHEHLGYIKLVLHESTAEVFMRR